MSVPYESTVAHANTLRAVSVLRTFVARRHRLSIMRRRRFVLGNLLAVVAVAFVAREADAVVASVSVVAFRKLRANVRAAALVDVDANLGGLAVGT